MRVRIAELLVFTAVVAGAFACMTHGQYLSAGIFTSFIMMMLLLALLMAIAVCGEQKFFWVGFATAGLVYAHYAGLMYSVEFKTRLVTESTFLIPLFEWSHFGESIGDVRAIGGGGFGGGGGIRNSEEYKCFMQTGHGLVTFCLAWFGGQFVVMVRRNSKKANQAPVETKKQARRSKESIVIGKID